MVSVKPPLLHDGEWPVSRWPAATTGPRTLRHKRRAGWSVTVNEGDDPESAQDNYLRNLIALTTFPELPYGSQPCHPDPK